MKFIIYESFNTCKLQSYFNWLPSPDFNGNWITSHILKKITWNPADVVLVRKDLPAYIGLCVWPHNHSCVFWTHTKLTVKVTLGSLRSTKNNKMMSSIRVIFINYLRNLIIVWHYIRQGILFYPYNDRQALDMNG